MTQLTLDMPESAFASLHQAPKEFAQEMRIAAAVKIEKLRLSGLWLSEDLVRILTPQAGE